MNLNDLFTYLTKKKDIEGLILEIKEIESVIYDPGHPKLDLQPRSTKQTDLSDRLQKYLELQTRYIDKLTAFLSLTDDINKALDALEPSERQVIRCRYILGMTVKRVAEQENYSERQVKRITRNALKKLQ